ncbi:MAG TPA: pyruvate kinase, partial [Clostridium sp.]
MQKTKMIFTIGPASDNEEMLRTFINIGMSAARLNFSHGTHESHKEKIILLKKIREEMDSPTAIILDIKGPKIRTHNFINDGVEIEKGQEFSFICGEEILGDNTKCSITYDILYRDVKPGGSILVDDGLLKFEIINVVGQEIKCKAIVGGLIQNHKGVNVPNVIIQLPSITEKDIEDIAFGCEMGVDFIAASFIRKASDILEVRRVLKKYNGEHIQIIAKIENQEGVANIDSIIEVTDCVMVARGDMGV